MAEFERTRVISGFRPTNETTIGHYVGAIKPSLEIQEDPNSDLYLFVADIHGITDKDPRDVAEYRHNIVKDCMALGIDAERTTIYMQSDVETSIVPIANRIAPYVNVGELSRIPTLKEMMRASLRKGEDLSQANLAMLSYPALMAADIYAQEATVVAAGEDQAPNVELTRKIARKFNREFSEGVLVEPQLLSINALRILSLDGKSKMASSNPDQAILLSDDPERARAKIQSSTTAQSGEWNAIIESHFRVAEAMADDEATLDELRRLKLAHIAGKAVMGDFKRIWSEATEQFLDNFQGERQKINDDDIQSALRYNADTAERNAEKILRKIKSVTGF